MGGDFVAFGTQPFRYCSNLICVDFSHCTLSSGTVGTPAAAAITGNNTAKFVWPEAMRTKLQASSWLTNTTIAQRVVIVPDPKEMTFTYADGTKLEFSFA